MTYKRILVPVDGSPTARLGLREAIRLARGQKAAVHLVHVVDGYHVAMMGVEGGAYIGELLESLERSGRRLLRAAEAQVRRAGVPVRTALLENSLGPAADAIVRQARKSGADLIVIGTHGRRGVSRVLMGSDAEQVVRNSPVPVLLVRGRR